MMIFSGAIFRNILSNHDLIELEDYKYTSAYYQVVATPPLSALPLPKRDAPNPLGVYVLPTSFPRIASNPQIE